MIERLMNPEQPYGEPEYSRMARQIAEIRETLENQLDAEGKQLLKQMDDAYLRQSNSLLQDVFTEGFYTAVELMLDYLRYKH